MENRPEQTILTKQQFAYKRLRDSILNGAFEPGRRIVIDAVSQEYGMSAIPVREAIGQLEREGLLTVRPHVGAVVSDIPLHAIEEIFALLESLEIAAVRIGIESLDGAKIGKLESFCGRMESTDSVAEWARLNRRFHEAIPEMLGLSRVREFLVRVGEDWERLRKLRFSDAAPEDLASANREHREFIKFLKAGDADKGESWIRRHNRNALRKYSKMGIS